MKVTGRQVAYTYASHGLQHRFRAADGTVMSYNRPARMTISFGDGTVDAGAEAGMACQTNSPVSAFSANQRGNHLYKKPGTYKIVVRTQFCGNSGVTTEISTYSVTVR